MAALTDLLARQYPFHAVVEPSGGWSIVFPDLPGCTSYAETWEEIGPEARTAFVMWMEIEHEQGHPIPAPTVDSDGPTFGPESFTVPEAARPEDGAALPEVATVGPR